MSEIQIGDPCPECGARTSAAGAYFPSVQAGPDRFEMKCTECDWTRPE